MIEEGRLKTNLKTSCYLMREERHLGLGPLSVRLSPPEDLLMESGRLEVKYQVQSDLVRASSSGRGEIEIPGKLINAYSQLFCNT